MRKMVSKFVVVAGGVALSSLALADDMSGGQGGGGAGLWAIGSGLAMGLSALGGTLAQGKAAGSALEGIARNPGSQSQVFMPMIIALALIEAQAIMGFIIAFMWLNK